jgi:hypothetical protein
MIFASSSSALEAAGIRCTFELRVMRRQGASIGEGCLIDTLDVADFPLLHIGDRVAANFGASILGHTIRDGAVHFQEVRGSSPL